MKTIIKSTILASASLFILVSCSEDNEILDTTKPEVIIGKPTEHQEFELGEDIDFEALFKDNIELASYKIEIHSGNDGHDHGNDHNHSNKSPKPTETGEVEKWNYTNGGTLSGKEQTIQYPITIPAEGIEEGHYHLGVFVLDKAGNETQSFIEIVIGEDHHH